jgi:hypothetical protein
MLANFLCIFCLRIVSLDPLPCDFLNNKDAPGLLSQTPGDAPTVEANWDASGEPTKDPSWEQADAEEQRVVREKEAQRRQEKDAEVRHLKITP